MNGDMLVRFWGVRGSTPVPGPTTLRYGGNTACVEVRCGPHVVILDAGTGLRELGDHLLRDRGVQTYDLFVTHPHLDHMMGLPYFAPLYEADKNVSIWKPLLSGEGVEEDWVGRISAPPYFPIRMEQMAASVERHSFATGSIIRRHDIFTIKSMVVPHPGGAVGLRIESAEASVVYLTDVELDGDCGHGAVTEFSAGADLLICDAMFTDDEKAAHRGWGHSTWQDAVGLAQKAGVGRLILFHHAPKRTDRALDEIGWKAASLFPATQVASEGLSLWL